MRELTNELQLYKIQMFKKCNMLGKGRGNLILNPTIKYNIEGFIFY